MYNVLKAIAVAGLTSISMAGMGVAATVYDATSATSGSNDHSFWFGSNPFGGSKFWQFDTVGIFTTYTQGGMDFASLTGTIQQNGAASNQLQVDAVFKLRGVGDAFSGPNTKCGAVGSAGVGECNGDDTWAYYDYDSVLLTGLNALDGLTLELSDKTGGNIPPQLGDGANDKDTGFGYSTWFNWEVTKAGTTGFDLGRIGHGDINIKLGNERDSQDPEPVPLPAGGLLLISALVGMGVVRRRSTRI